MESGAPEIPLAAGTTVVTVNQRLAGALRAAHDARQLAAGRSLWERADILPWRAWLERSWRSHALRAMPPPPVLLSPWQERALWEAVLSEQARGELEPGQAGAGLLQTGPAARRAQEALALLKAHRCERALAAEPLAEDALAFQRWRQAVARRCREAGWLDGASMPDRLARGLPGVRDELPARLLVAGFDELTPQQRDLFSVLRRIGVSVDAWVPPVRAGRAVRVALESHEEELTLAARWARRLLESEVGGPIGIVIPDLARQRARVQRILDQVLCPSAGPRGEDARPYNITLGPPLAHAPLVADALRALRLGCGRIGFAELSQIMRSPHVRGGESERHARALREAALRERLPPELTLQGLCAHLAADRGRHCAAMEPAAPVFGRIVEDLAHGVRRAPPVQSTGAWAETFWEWLRIVGWPGERALTSAEYQTLQAFAELLAELASVSSVVGVESAGGALARLSRMAAERVFQPRSDPAPVQVLGALEATGLRFSRLWVAGLHDGAWPPPPRPNPFLPVSLQRRYGMPHASAQRELEFARRVTAGLVSAADAVVLSHALREDEAPLRPSPLIAHFAGVAASTVAASHWRSRARHVHAARPVLETLHDERGPALAADAPPGGGARLFRDQAACPFRAFAVHRLGACGLATPASGMDPRTRGVLAHRLMAALWAELGDQRRLRALAGGEREALVARALEAVLARGRRALGGRLSQPEWALEGSRLQRLALEWLAQEERRAPFEVVGVESQVQARLGGLDVSLRVDRVDRVAARGLFLIDYKTGRSRVAGWFGTRPDEPQLPLYCTASSEPVAGVAYASLRRDRCGFQGIAEAAEVAPGVRAAPDWPRLTAQWREALTHLAAAFAGGDARVDPKRGSETCRDCGLQPLCRIHERGARSAPPAELR